MAQYTQEITVYGRNLATAEKAAYHCVIKWNISQSLLQSLNCSDKSVVSVGTSA